MPSIDDFWHYSIRVYSQPAVKQLCLNLQNSAQLNVNLLLLCGYLELQKIRLSIAQFEQLKSAITVVDAQTQDVRRQRITAKNENSDHYQTLLKLELDYERKQQQQLINKVQSIKDAAQPLSNFTAYYRSAVGKGDPKSQIWLKELQVLITDETH